jgi:hypothetical protein
MLTRVLRKRAPSEGRVRPQSRDGALGHPVKASFLPILLCSRGTQAGEAVAIDRALPDEKFIDRERVAAASLLQREQTTAHRSYHLCLATDHPAFCPGGGRSAIVNGLPSGPITYLGFVQRDSIGRSDRVSMPIQPRIQFHCCRPSHRQWLRSPQGDT